MKFKFHRFSKSTFKKTAIISTALILTITPLTLLSINWSSLNILYAAGSSAVAPLMEKLVEVYHGFGMKNSIDITISVTGSGNGLESVVQNTKNYGNVSWAPTRSKIINTDVLPALTAWEDNRVKTFTLGIDGIGVVYKAPADVDLNIDQTNIEKLYSAISGTASYTYGDLIGTANTTPIVAYARAGGSAKSGTTDAFLKDSGFKVDKKAPYYKALETGSYGAGVQSTKESNVETWKQISSGGGQGEMGAISYLSAGFIVNNREEIDKAGFRVATYGTNATELSIVNITNKIYKWYRPLNTLISLEFNKENSAAREWLEWLFYNYHDDKIISGLEQVGVVPLTREQLNTMTIDGNLWVSDFEIMPYSGNGKPGTSTPEDMDKYKWGAQL